MRANGASGKQIWITEFGWQVPTDCDEATQATRYKELLSSVVLSGSGGGPRVTRAIAYTYDYMGNDSSSLYNLAGTRYMAADAVFSNFISQNSGLVGKFAQFMAHA